MSAVTICNTALGMLGAQSITSLDESSDRARLCKTFYESSRQALLRMHPWSCATKRVEIAPLATAPVFGWGYAFPLPADFVRVLDCNETDYRLEDRHVLSNSGVLHLVYVYDNQNESTWDSLLTEAMSIMLASKLAKPLTGSSAESDSQGEALRVLLKQARAINGQEVPSRQVGQDFELLMARL